MTYQFNLEMAVTYGVEEAVFIHNIFFWVFHNEANRKHFYEGRYWTYNTKKAYTEHFPFWTYEQVKRITKNLTNKGVLLIGNFNQNTWDKTLWYSLSDEVLDSYKKYFNVSNSALLQTQQSNGAIATIEGFKSNNRTVETQQSNIGTDNKPYSKQHMEGALAFFEVNFPERYDRLMVQFKSQINDFVNFSQMFDATVQQERLEYDGDVLEGRFKKYAFAWIRNQVKFDGKVVELNPVSGSNKKIGGF